jgi:glycosyltransferase involved in cell wall biosynthesis
MKILHIIDSGGLYGAEFMLLNLVAEQIDLGLKPTIASIGEKNNYEKPLEVEAMKRGFKVEKFRMRPGPNIAGALKLLRFAHAEGFDLMHSHGYKGNILIGLLPKFIRKLPLLTTLHGWTSVTGLSKLKAYELLDSLSLNFMDAVVLVNKGMLNNPKLKQRNQLYLHIINNGIPPGKNQKDSAAENLDPAILDFCSKGFIVGSIGRLSSEKGYEYLINAIDLLVDSGIDVRLAIIGEGDKRDYLEKLISQKELTGKVLLPGYRDNAKNYLRFFNVFVISSLTEGLPISILEAMQAKVPIVASEVGGIPDTLDNGNAGLLVKPCKKSDLSEAIIKIYHDADLAERLINNAYQRVNTSYSSKAMALEYFNVYKKLI